MSSPTALYIHIPFCASKCFYCDFNTYSFHKEQADAYLNTLWVEMSMYAPMGASLQTIFIGGGTPSILSPDSLRKMFTNLQENFQIEADAEVTVECNPGTIDAEKLAIMRDSDVNRLSFGVQAMDDDILQQIGRIHSVNDVLNSYQMARKHNFNNINLDLIFALPEQTLDQWQYSLDKVINLSPDHISVYNLTLEEGTKFYDWWNAGKLVLPDNEIEADMYRLSIDRLTQAGYLHYEISNFAKLGCDVKHNLIYWNNEPYIGLGAGASGYIDGCRYTNVRGIPEYIEQVDQGKKPIMYQERLVGIQEMAETIILGLQKRDGICFDRYQKLFGQPITKEFGQTIDQLAELGLVETSNNHLRLTDQGLMLANYVFTEFL
ncbi:TPA: oxygen-independent coproporphyrinogen III oxidase [Candidatus Poribacteria bacterium]|nr:oxygen-independent coproporphyrinogen III oxidase [Candidatus Poribacteria bacterium]